jgi:hypothetical protein
MPGFASAQRYMQLSSGWLAADLFGSFNCTYLVFVESLAVFGQVSSYLASDGENENSQK